MPQPTFSEMWRVFARIGCLSFGGPAGQIALMHRELVEERQWIGEDAFLRALNFCHLLPGPEAQQLATYIGWRFHGVRGGLAAGLLFVIPGVLIILALSVLYAYAARLDWFQALFIGVKAAVLAIVAQALIRIGKRALNGRFKLALALAAFVALFFFDLPFPLVVLGAGLIGAMFLANSATPLRPSATGIASPWRTSLKAAALWLAIWSVPMLFVLVLLGPDHVLWKVGALFSQLAVVTFGGAYAVLAYMAQEAIQSYKWLSAGEMADGLGLAETTPGPLILVTQFVGFLAAFRAPEPFAPLVAGMLGAGLTLWVTFAPCFLWIFTLAPWIERLERARQLQAGLAAITAAIVGVIANLTAWFALTILFARVGEARAGPLRLYAPEWASFDWHVALLALLAAIMLFGLKRGVVTTLAATTAAGLLLAAVA